MIRLLKLLPYLKHHRPEIWDRYAQTFPPRLLRVVTLPVGRHLSTDDAFRYESARMLSDAFAYVHNEQIRGDYLEFGVMRGRTFIEAWHAAQRFRLPSMRFHAFDSFEGLPKLSSHDAHGPFTEGQFSSSRRTFERGLKANGIPADRVTITEGFFDDTLLDARVRQTVDTAAVVWIDCDLYESTVPVLDYITPLLVEGSVVVFDDWYCFRARPDRGEQRACAEWLGANPELRLVPYRTFGWAGQSFIVNRDA
jgi:hypothetical protein